MNKTDTKDLKDILIDLKNLNLQKYKNPEFKKKLLEFNNITDVMQKLHPYDRLILIYENLIENSLLLYSLNPNKEMLEISKKFENQARDFYEKVIKIIFNNPDNPNSEAKKIEEDKIKKLEEFMNSINIEL